MLIEWNDIVADEMYYFNHSLPFICEWHSWHMNFIDFHIVCLYHVCGKIQQYDLLHFAHIQMRNKQVRSDKRFALISSWFQKRCILKVKLKLKLILEKFHFSPTILIHLLIGSKIWFSLYVSWFINISLIFSSCIFHYWLEWLAHIQ